MKIAQMSSEERPREKMMYFGAKGVTNADLIAVLLRTGTRQESAVEIAQKMLADCDGFLTELSTRSIENLSAAG